MDCFEFYWGGELAYGYCTKNVFFGQPLLIFHSFQKTMRLGGDCFTKKTILIRYGQLYAQVAFFRLVTAVMSRNATWTGTMILLMQPLGVHYQKGCLKLLVSHGMHYLLQLVLDEQTSPSSIFDFIKLRIA